MAQTVVPPAVEVQRTAPQLVAFAGSTSNFQNLVNGLAQGTPVQLVTILPDGFTQIVNFTPTVALPPVQIAQVLETARQQLIGIGIGNPTGEQIAVALMGGVVPTALGGSQVAGVLNPQSPQNPPSPAAQIQANAAAGATTSTTPTGTATPTTVTPPVTVQIFPSATTSTATTAVPPRVNTSDSLVAPGTTSRSPVATTPTTPGTAGATPPTSGQPSTPLIGAPAAPPAPAASSATTTTPSPAFGASPLRR